MLELYLSNEPKKAHFKTGTEETTYLETTEGISELNREKHRKTKNKMLLGKVSFII